MFLFLIRILLGALVAPVLVVLAIVLAMLGVWPVVWVPVLLLAALVAFGPLLGLGSTMPAAYRAQRAGRQITG